VKKVKTGWSAPRTRTVGLREKAWWVIRKNRSITLAELMLTICKGSEKTPRVNLQRWLTPLVNVAVLSRQRVSDGKQFSNGSYRYTLMRDLGPKAPVVRAKAGEVFDPNSQTVLEKVGGEDG
jgi:hypothetical protein